jgi:hypothetical protein
LGRSWLASHWGWRISRCRSSTGITADSRRCHQQQRLLLLLHLLLAACAATWPLLQAGNEGLCLQQPLLQLALLTCQIDDSLASWQHSKGCSVGE